MTQPRRTYQIQVALPLLAYGVLLVGSIILVRGNPDAGWRFPVVVVPILPFAYGVLAYIRYLGNVDELQRKIALEALALAFGGTAIFTFAYGLLEGAGLPHLNWTYVWMVMGGLWLVGGFVARWRYQ